MKISHLKKASYTVGKWSGGVTTQLYIYPEDGDYSSRHFKVRISSAAVELEESDFTPLPGVTRYITPLEGGFTLSHPDGGVIKMEPLDAPYRFDGGFDTHCAGKAADFNLMLKGVEGSMEILEGGCDLSGGLTAIYPIGDGVVAIGERGYILSEGDMLVIEQGSGRAAFERAIVCKADI